MYLVFHCELYKWILNFCLHPAMPVPYFNTIQSLRPVATIHYHTQEAAAHH